jgi:hypothetical protein
MLSLVNVNPNNPNDVWFQFYLLDDSGNQTAGYGFRSFQSHDFSQSSNINSTLQKGDWDQSLIPVHESDAVVMTVTSAPSTWAIQAYLVRLVLRGLLLWEWQATFENAVFPFRLDGAWRQTW